MGDKGHVWLTATAAVLLAFQLACRADETPPLHAARSGRSLDINAYHQLVERLAGDANAARVVFARAALAELIDAYYAELGRASAEQSSDAKRRAETSRWVRSTLGFVQHLERVAAAVTDATAVTLIIDLDGVVRMVLGGAQVMVSPPRGADLAGVEQRIVDQVCVQLRCDAELPSLESRVATRSQDYQLTWEFGDREPPTLRAQDGLACRFRDRTHLVLRQQACERAIGEMRLLAEALRTLRYEGRHIDWGIMRILPGGPGELHRVMVDRAGNFIELALPLTARTDASLELGKAWLRAQLNGAATNYVLSLSDDAVYLATFPPGTQ
jgi:hypothetical protein